MWVNSGGRRWTGRPAVHGVTEGRTRLSDWTELKFCSGLTDSQLHDFKKYSVFCLLGNSSPQRQKSRTSQNHTLGPCVSAWVPNCFQLFTTPRTVACKTPLSMGVSRQEDWSGLPCPPPGGLPDPGFEPMSPASPPLTGGFITTEPAGKPVHPLNLPTHSAEIYVYFIPRYYQKWKV